jgi:hypothetical protein
MAIELPNGPWIQRTEAAGLPQGDFDPQDDRLP